MHAHPHTHMYEHTHTNTHTRLLYQRAPPLEEVVSQLEPGVSVGLLHSPWEHVTLILLAIGQSENRCENGSTTSTKIKTMPI